MPSTCVWTGAISGSYSTGGNWLGGAVPGAGDSVRIPRTASQAITAGLNQSAVAIVDFIVEAGCTVEFGSSTGYLQIDPDRFIYEGTGIGYFDLGAANIDVQVLNTAGAATGAHGLYLKGSNLKIVHCNSGSVGVAVLPGETATIVTARTLSSQANITLGAGVTCTNVLPLAGTIVTRTNITTATVAGGTVQTEESAVITTLTLNGGNFKRKGGGVTTVTLNGGICDFTQCGAAHTVTTLTQNAGSTLIMDPAVTTITTRAAPSGPVRITAAALAA